MNIVKWILVRPLSAIWILAFAILLVMASRGGHEAAATHDVKSDVVGTEEVKMKPELHEVSSTNLLPEAKDVQDENVQSESAQDAVEAPAVMQVVDPNSIPDNNSDPFLSNSTEAAKNNKPIKKEAVIAEDLGQLETDELLLMAREAYWNNGLDEAAQIYQQLIKREPQVIEHKGELGNVYWRQGYPKKAAELYSEIAIPLIESGSSGRVSNMVGFIQLFYPDRVEVIMDRLERNKQK